MKILHITPSAKGYEEVTLLANRISKTNGFSAIEKNGEQFMSGGFLINDTPQIRAVLDAIPTDKQYDFVKEFKQDPFVKFYLEEESFNDVIDGIIKKLKIPKTTKKQRVQLNEGYNKHQCNCSNTKDKLDCGFECYNK